MHECKLVDGLLHLGGVGRVNRDSDNTRTQARPEYDEELGARREAQQHTFAMRNAPCAEQKASKCAGAPPQHPECKNTFLVALGIEPREARLARIFGNHARRLYQHARGIAVQVPPARAHKLRRRRHKLRRTSAELLLAVLSQEESRA